MRKVTRDVNEDVRDRVRALANTEVFRQSRRERKKVEMRFAHMKRILKFDRLRLRGLLPEQAPSSAPKINNATMRIMRECRSTAAQARADYLMKSSDARSLRRVASRSPRSMCRRMSHLFQDHAVPHQNTDTLADEKTGRHQTTNPASRTQTEAGEQACLCHHPGER
jgi:hypothetical protein